MLKIQKSSDAKTKWVKMLLYGCAGIGKTVFASTAPSPLILDCEGGLLSVVDKNVDYISIKQWSDIKDVFMEIVADKIPNETIIIDSLTELSKKSMDYLLGAVGKGQTSAQSEKILPTMQDWLKNIEEVRRLVRAFRDLQKHIIMTCLIRDEKNEVTGSVSRKPSVSAKSLADDIVGYFDVVGYMETDKDNKRWILVQPYKTSQGYFVPAKDRSGKLETFEEPNFTKIVEKICGAKNNKKKGVKK